MGYCYIVCKNKAPHDLDRITLADILGGSDKKHIARWIAIEYVRTLAPNLFNPKTHALQKDLVDEAIRAETVCLRYIGGGIGKLCDITKFR